VTYFPHSSFRRDLLLSPGMRDRDKDQTVFVVMVDERNFQRM